MTWRPLCLDSHLGDVGGEPVNVVEPAAATAAAKTTQSTEAQLIPPSEAKPERWAPAGMFEPLQRSLSQRRCSQRRRRQSAAASDQLWLDCRSRCDSCGLRALVRGWECRCRSVGIWRFVDHDPGAARRLWASGSVHRVDLVGYTDVRYHSRRDPHLEQSRRWRASVHRI